jgi:hypothetical protein
VLACDSFSLSAPIFKQSNHDRTTFLERKKRSEAEKEEVKSCHRE